MFKQVVAAAFAVALMAPAAFANGIVTLESDIQSVVFLDDEEVGTTPITLRDIRPGYHKIRLENPHTGQARVFNFFSPRHSTVEKQFAVDFSREPMGPARKVVVQEEVVVQPPPPEPKKDNTKVRMRNVALGAGLLNEVFNKGKGKSTVRKGVVGAGLLNEVLNR